MDQKDINQEEWEKPTNWTGPRWLSVYCSKRDSRVWVPKQIPALGWTVNLGQRGGVAWLVFILAGIVVVVGIVLAVLRE